ncbi:MAG: 3-dehydroquinate synthase [Gammaproteobacteria bacterium]|nr:3-dehydroquinate synthase [Gammaproteobacteria bacterium]
MTTHLEVALGNRSYRIHIGAGLLGEPQLIRPHLAGNQVLVVSNETVAPLYLESLRGSLADLEVFEHILPDGEAYKTLESLNGIFDTLLRAPCDRQATIVALGGGVVGDMAGFAAACYQRGIAYIQVPTTLLAQVDSSVGGKTAVNHPLGKNMIGAFHQPRCVIADTDVLATLPDRELAAGLAEVIKYGLIRDLEFLAWLESSLDALLARDSAALAHAIEVSCRNKAAVVAADEREAGQRALLNLGHSFGHAIETGMGYGRWLHGEAVAAGMCMAADLSRRMGRIAQSDVDRVTALLTRAGLPVAAPAELNPERLRELMSVDKKVRAGRLHLVLLNHLGDACISDQVPEPLILETLTACRSPA